MKRFLIPMVAVVLGLVSQMNLAQAAEKEVSLKGELQCGKCALNEAKECENVLVVKENGKEVKYYLARNGVSKKYDEKTCGGDKIPVTVTGQVAEKEGKKILTASKIEG